MKFRKTFLVLIFGLALLLRQEKAYAAEDIVVVIDPGHGGENRGTSYLPTDEKYYNMAVALAMKERLEEYEKITVYLTHTQDVDMSLQERAEFAASVDADFLFSLHFNESVGHAVYGSEVWIPSEGTLYTQGCSMANEFMKEFDELGLFHRGIKTKLGKNGDDYYGIIRNSALFDIPAIIVEHCHVDNAFDAAYLSSKDALYEFGKRDADAVARYFGLSAKDGSVDNSGYAPLAVPVPKKRVRQDVTPPVYAKAEMIFFDRFRGNGVFHLSSLEQESYLQHYAYSLDDGLTWSIYYPWTRGVNNMTIPVNFGFCNPKAIIFKVLNQYDNATESNPIFLYGSTKNMR